MADSQADNRATKPNLTGTQELSVGSGLRIHQITVHAGTTGLGGAVAAFIKPESAQGFIPLMENDGITPVSITVGAANSDTGRCAKTSALSLEAIKLVGTGVTYSVGYAAFDA